MSPRDCSACGDQAVCAGCRRSGCQMEPGWSECQCCTEDLLAQCCGAVVRPPRDVLVEALAGAFRRGGAETDLEASSLAASFIDDPEALAYLARACGVAAAAKQGWRDAQGLRATPAQLQRIGEVLGMLAVSLGGGHTLEERSS